MARPLLGAVTITLRGSGARLKGVATSAAGDGVTIAYDGPLPAVPGEHDAYWHDLDVAGEIDVISVVGPTIEARVIVAVSGADQRRDRRMRTTVPVAITIEHPDQPPIEGQVIDFAAGGVSATLPTPIRIGDTVRFRLVFETGRSTVTNAGSVLRCERADGGWYVVLQNTTAPPIASRERSRADR